MSERRAGERVIETGAKQPAASGRESDEGQAGWQAQVGELEDSKCEELKFGL